MHKACADVRAIIYNNVCGDINKRKKKARGAGAVGVVEITGPRGQRDGKSDRRRAEEIILFLKDIYCRCAFAVV